METFNDPAPFQGTCTSRALQEYTTPHLVSSDCCLVRVIHVNDESVCARCGCVCNVTVE